jgi:hypothetical protein
LEIGALCRFDFFLLAGDTPTIYAGANITGDNEKNDGTDKPQVYSISIFFFHSTVEHFYSSSSF